MSNFINVNEVFRTIDARKAAAAALSSSVGKEVKFGAIVGTLLSVTHTDTGACVLADGTRYGVDPRRVKAVDAA